MPDGYPNKGQTTQEPALFARLSRFQNSFVYGLNSVHHASPDQPPSSTTLRAPNLSAAAQTADRIRNIVHAHEVAHDYGWSMNQRPVPVARYHLNTLSNSR